MKRGKVKGHGSRSAIRTLCGMAALLVLLTGFSVMPVSAAGNGIYIATATPHYRHPTTGIIEDAGGDSTALGQSMTESVLYRKALVEVDASGNTYVTVRLQLMDNIKDPQFMIDGVSVSASLMQEDYTENTADYRMKVPDENAVIRCNLYVIAMGRDVIFYITVGNLQAGSEDFITSITVTSTEPQTPTQTADTSQTSDAQNGTDAPQTPDTQITGSQTADNQTSDTDPGQKGTETDGSQGSAAGETKDPAGDTAPEDPKKEDTVVGLQEFDKNGDKVDGALKNDVSSSGSSGVVVWWILGIAAVLVMVGFGVWYFCFFKKKPSYKGNAAAPGLEGSAMRENEPGAEKLSGQNEADKRE